MGHIMTLALAASRPALSERLINFRDIVDFRPAESPEDREAIHRLRYKAYRREGMIAEDASGLCIDEYDDLPNTRSFGLYVAGQLTSTLRLSVLSADVPHSPSMSIFSDILQPMISAGEVIIDPSRFAADFDCARAYPELPYMTLRVAVMACMYFDADRCLASSRPEHSAFYRRVFQSKPLSDIRRYDYYNFPVRMTGVDVESLKQTLFKRYPFFSSHYLDQRQLFGAKLPEKESLAA
jgi:hypothetical protein